MKSINGLSASVIRELTGALKNQKLTEAFLAQNVWWWRLAPDWAFKKLGSQPSAIRQARHLLNFPAIAATHQKYEEARKVSNPQEVRNFNTQSANSMAAQGVWILRYLDLNLFHHSGIFDKEQIFFYEMTARMTGAFPFGTDWLRCRSFYRHFIADVFAKLYGDDMTMPFVQVYARDSQTNINNAIWRELNSFRQKQGIPLPTPGRKEGELGHRRSFKVLEYLDIQSLQIRILNDSERSSVSKARKQYLCDVKEKPSRFESNPNFEDVIGKYYSLE